MIETGIVKEKRNGGIVLVEFGHLQTAAECSVLQPTTGKNNVFSLPSAGTQVVCWLESGKNIVLGAVFSDTDKVPAGADPEGEFRQHGDAVLEMKDGAAALKQGAAYLELTGEKAALKNSQTDLKTILNEFAEALKSLTVSTSTGPSGTPLPPTIQAATKIGQLISTLFN